MIGRKGGLLAKGSGWSAGSSASLRPRIEGSGVKGSEGWPVKGGGFQKSTKNEEVSG